MYTSMSSNKKLSRYQFCESANDPLMNEPNSEHGRNGPDNKPQLKTLFDLSAITLTNRLFSAQDIYQVVPHRYSMCLLDHIVWKSADNTQGIALKQVTEQEFWVPGHFPNHPIMPGVLMIEAGAQLACFLVNNANQYADIGLFLHIEKATFRMEVRPGDPLFILCHLEHKKRRIYRCQLQGIANDKIAFDACIVGMSSNTAATR